MMRGFRGAIRDAWRLTRPYFSSEERWSARLLLASIVALSLGMVAMNVLLNEWNGQFFNSLQQKDATAFEDLLLFWRQSDDGFMPGFCAIVAVYIPVAIYRTWLRQLLTIRWRRWMTERLMADWLADRAYFTIGLQGTGLQQVSSDGVDNPDQRITEDVRSFTTDTLSLGLGLLSNIVSLVSFAQILWVLSGPLTLYGVTIPGYMLFVAIVYAVVGTTLTHLVGRPLVPIEFQKQRFEADFRFGLIRVRENAEGVALYGGEQSEQRRLTGFLTAVVGNFRAFMSRQKKLNALVFGYEQVAAIFPIVVAAPRYFRGEIPLGGLTRVSGAFGQVQSSLSWFIDAYAQLAVWRATVERLTTFNGAIGAARALAGGGVRVRPGGEALRLDDVTLALPGGRMLMQHGAFTFAPGRSAVVSGRSGSGKSTLFRAIAGIWPFGSGTVTRPPGRLLFLPQRPYIPLGTLRQVVTYPADPAAYADLAIIDALTAAGLGSLAAELDREEPWTQRLSGGEQQRLAVARALLLRPDWLFLDEATASLDPESEADLYRQLQERLPGTTILSIAHRREVERWHDDTLVFHDGALTPKPPG